MPSRRFQHLPLCFFQILSLLNGLSTSVEIAFYSENIKVSSGISVNIMLSTFAEGKQISEN
jgi:hypothetical protein